MSLYQRNRMRAYSANQPIVVRMKMIAAYFGISILGAFTGAVIGVTGGLAGADEDVILTVAGLAGVLLGSRVAKSMKKNTIPDNRAIEMIKSSPIVEQKLTILFDLIGDRDDLMIKGTQKPNKQDAVKFKKLTKDIIKTAKELEREIKSIKTIDRKLKKNTLQFLQHAKSGYITFLE